MIYNYFITAIRNMLRNKIHSVINMLGLTVGLACCILIGIYIQHELSYDRFHANADQIYRVVRQETLTDKVQVSVKTPVTIPSGLLDHFPEVEQALGFIDRWFVLVEVNGKKFNQRFLTADPAFVDVFSFSLVRGDIQTALKDPYSILITERMAHKFFGHDDPIGQVIHADWGDYTVTGVLKDAPQNSSIYFELLTTTMKPNTYRNIENYVVLAKGTEVQEFETKMNTFFQTYIGSDRARSFQYYLQPLTRVHLYSFRDYGWRGGQGDINQVYILVALGCFILFISCANFVNLTTALSSKRFTEVGVRKSVGAYQGQLIWQFLCESVFMTFLSVLLAAGVVLLVLPAFGASVGKDLSLNSGGLLSFGGSMVTLIVCVGFLAGCYPAFYLSRFHPVGALKGGLKAGRKDVWIRKGLTVFQFGISVVLILGTAVTYGQAQFMRHKDKGYDEAQLVVLDLFRLDKSLRSRREEIKQTFLAHPNVIHATATAALIGSHRMEPVWAEGQGDRVMMRLTDIDEHALETFGMQLVAGRNISFAFGTDQKQAYLINETAVKAFGWDNPIGKEFEWLRGGSGRKGKVVGVVKDFHHFHLKHAIEPLFMCYRPGPSSLSLRIRPENRSETFAFLKQTWAKYSLNHPFEYRQMHELLNQNYEEDYRFGQMFSLCSIMAIFVTLLGLVGLMSFMVDRRAKEMSIRRVLGASLSHIIGLLSGEFLKLVLIANVVALPLGYILMRQWLDQFTYRIHLGGGLLALAGLLVLGITFVVVGYQAFKAATTNPVDSLRQE